MYYKVQGTLMPESAKAFHTKLTDGSIEAQEPDGREIVASMERAVVTDAGAVEWSEQCFCAEPLHHERTTVYDHYFTGFRTELVDGYLSHQGRPFMEYLAEVANEA